MSEIQRSDNQHELKVAISKQFTILTRMAANVPPALQDEHEGPLIVEAWLMVMNHAKIVPSDIPDAFMMHSQSSSFWPTPAEIIAHCRTLENDRDSAIRVAQRIERREREEAERLRREAEKPIEPRPHPMTFEEWDEIMRERKDRPFWRELGTDRRRNEAAARLRADELDVVDGVLTEDDIQRRDEQIRRMQKGDA